MQIFIFVLMSLLTTSNKPLQIDFGQKKDGQDWRVIDDGVMGGLSEGRVNFEKDAVSYKGEVSLENNGGFSSFRSPYQDFYLSNYEKVVIRLKSKGQVLALTMSMDRRWYMPYFKQQIQVESEDWEVVELSLSEFSAYRIGQKLDRKFSTDDAKD
ncbi:MAG: CIA30 family protein, partial [Bacteroidota bacterium]